MHVSVRILCYNQEAYLEKALNSVLLQKTKYSFEVIIGDDCSTDRSREILLRYQEKYPDLIKLVLNQKNVGQMQNWINITNLCRGDYIVGCAGDDYWIDEYKIEKQVQFLEQNPEYAVVYSKAEYVDKDCKVIERNKNSEIYKEGDIFNDLLLNSFIVAGSACVRRKAIEDIDFSLYLKEKFPMEDLPTWLLISRKWKFKFFDTKLIAYRMLDTSITNTKDFEKQIEYAKASFRVRKYFLELFNINEALKNKVYFYHYRMMFYKHIKNGKRYKSLKYLKQINNLGFFNLKYIIALLLLRSEK